jgi:hypothetical protein
MRHSSRGIAHLISDMLLLGSPFLRSRRKEDLTLSARNLRLGLGVLAGLLAGACEDRSAEREPTAPDVAATPSIVPMGSGHVYHFTSQGSFGDLSFAADMGDAYEWGYLAVYQGGTRKDRQVLLYYDITQCGYATYECTSVEGGNGLIPSGDLVQEGNTLTLNTNTSTAPEFSLYAGSGGPITISWTQTSGFTARENVNSRINYVSGLKARFHQTRTSFSAVAEGSMLGRALDPYAYATMGTVHSGEIDIEKNVKIEP